MKPDKNMFKKKLKIFIEDKQADSNSVQFIPLDSSSPHNKKRSTTGLRSKRKVKQSGGL